ncbi:MAG: hypothetical protein WC796_05620 [Candidatus Pacearchaeota archaeon]|jgi:hypothetical protein
MKRHLRVVTTIYPDGRQPTHQYFHKDSLFSGFSQIPDLDQSRRLGDISTREYVELTSLATQASGNYTPSCPEAPRIYKPTKVVKRAILETREE